MKLVAYTIGFVVHEGGRPSTVAADLFATSPVMRRAFPVMARYSVDDRFRRGLDVILDGALEVRRP